MTLHTLQILELTMHMHKEAFTTFVLNPSLSVCIFVAESSVFWEIWAFKVTVLSHGDWTSTKKTGAVNPKRRHLFRVYWVLTSVCCRRFGRNRDKIHTDLFTLSQRLQHILVSWSTLSYIFVSSLVARTGTLSSHGKHRRPCAANTVMNSIFTKYLAIFL